MIFHHNESRRAAGSRAWLIRLRSTLTDERLAFLLIAAFALLNLVGLDRVPLVNDDEPWIAETGLRFWERGVFASEMFRGFFGAEEHFLLHAPLFCLVTGGAVSLFGHGLIQVRLVSLAMATATAALTFFLGRRLLSSRHGLLAVLMLTAWRLTPGLPSQRTGIALVDLGRLARYDIAVPVAGVAAFLLILPLAERVAPPRWRLVLAGAIAGLGVMCHATGLAWIGILCVTVMAARGWSAGLAASGWIAAGTTVALLPWLVFMMHGWQDLLAQQAYIAHRYNLLDWRFYIENVWREWRRYGLIGRGLQHAQPGAWLIAISGLTGVWVLFRPAVGERSAGPGASSSPQGPERHAPRVHVLRTALVVGVALFTIGLNPKPYHYIAALWPLLALTAAVGLASLLRAPARLIRLTAIVMVMAAVAEGAMAWGRIMRQAASTTSYNVLCERLAAEIPRGSRVLALPSYWFCLAPRVDAYRTLVVPLLVAQTRFRSDPQALDDALSAVDANVLVLDRAMLTFMEQALDPANPAHQYGLTAKGLRNYLARRSARHVVIEDASYGRFEIHYLSPSSAIAGRRP
jgi:4-amino-4-deoxy-L-arabinose transferase-like glycosyltransferase